MKGNKREKSIEKLLKIVFSYCNANGVTVNLFSMFLHDIVK